MWYCSLCDRNLGEISADSNRDNQPTCPYCHCAVEEECRPMDGVVRVNKVGIQCAIKPSEEKGILPSASQSGSCESSMRAAEAMVEYIFELVARSLDESQYSEYSEDIIHIVRFAFEPNAKIAYGEIAKMMTDGSLGAGGGLVDLEESFEDDGVLLAKALTDVSTAIGYLSERMARIEETISSIEKQATLTHQKMRRKDTPWQVM